MTKQVKKTTSLEAFCKAIKKYDRFLLSCHVLPEGDAIGSLLAMDALLRQLGKKTTIICQDPFPKRLHCLSSVRWNRYQDIKKKNLKFDALLVTDCATLKRLGDVEKLITPEMAIFNIDHHVSNKAFGDYNYIVPKASASGEVVFEIYKKMRQKISKQAAKDMYIAITTDTGSFRYGNTTPKTFQVASELLESGLDVEALNEEVYSNYSLQKIDLYSRLFKRVKTKFSGKVAWVSVRRSDFTKSKTDFEDIEGFVDFLKLLKEVRIIFIVIELEKRGYVKVSMRARENYDVNKIASRFGGGGHKKASGLTIQDSIASIEQKILEELRKEFKS